MIYALFCFTNNIHNFTIVKNHSTVPIHQEGAQDQIYYSHMAQDINSKVGNSWSCFKTNKPYYQHKLHSIRQIKPRQDIISTRSHECLTNTIKSIHRRYWPQMIRAWNGGCMTWGCEIGFYRAITVVAQQDDLCIDHWLSISRDEYKYSVW